MTNLNFNPESFLNRKIKPKVAFPKDMKPEYLPLIGYYHKESNFYNILPQETSMEELGGIPPIVLGHFYPSDDSKIDKDDQIYGYWSAKQLKLGNKRLADLPYSFKTGILELISSDEEVLSIDGNKVKAVKEGYADLLVKNDSEIIFKASVEVIDASSMHERVMKDIRMLLTDCASIHIEDVARFFTADGEECEVEPYQLKTDIFSRNTGILESDIMLKKGALIIGCGSVGCLVAMELARAGVGRFFLVDMDIFGYHNICRHQCGIQDVGKYKTQAVKERILQINPNASVVTSNKRIQEVPVAELNAFCNKDTVAIGCADNREGDLYADEVLAKAYEMPFMAIGCWERAFAGEIFYSLPGRRPTYRDFMNTIAPVSGRSIANTHLYMGEVGTFEPGISADINFVTIIAVKMLLDILNRDNPNYTQRLIHGMTNLTFICNTNNPKIGGEMAEIFSYPLQVTTSILIDTENQQE